MILITIMIVAIAAGKPTVYVSEMQTTDDNDISIENVCDLIFKDEVTAAVAQESILSIDFDQTGRYLAFAQLDRLIVWDIHSNQVHFQLPLFGGNSVAFGSQSELAVAAFGLYIWPNVAEQNDWFEVSYEQRAGAPSIQSIKALSYDPETNEFVTLEGRDYALARWSISDQRLSFEDHEGPELFSEALPVLLNDEGSLAAAIQLHRNGVGVIDTRTGNVIGVNTALDTFSSAMRLLTFINVEGEPSLVLSVQDRSGAAQSTIYVLNLAGEIIQGIDYDFGTIWWLGATDRTNEILALWNVSDERLYFFGDDFASPLCSIDAGHSVTSLTFSPDGTMLATGSEDGTVRLWGIPADG